MGGKARKILCAHNHIQFSNVRAVRARYASQFFVPVVCTHGNPKTRLGFEGLKTSTHNTFVTSRPGTPKKPESKTHSFVNLSLFLLYSLSSPPELHNQSDSSPGLLRRGVDPWRDRLEESGS